MDKQALEKKITELKQQQEIAKQNFHQITGAIAVCEQMIADIDKPKGETDAKV